MYTRLPIDDIENWLSGTYTLSVRGLDKIHCYSGWYAHAPVGKLYMCSRWRGSQWSMLLTPIGNGVYEAEFKQGEN
jgi:hypothetical protein